MSELEKFQLAIEEGIFSFTVTGEDINDLLEEAEIESFDVDQKMTIVVVKLENGFMLCESSACVDPKNYNHDIGVDICLNRIKNKLWELEGYMLQQNKYDMEQNLRRDEAEKGENE